MKKITMFEHFSLIKDPRINRTLRHNLIDVIIIATCGVISSCETWVDAANQAIPVPKVSSYSAKYGHLSRRKVLFQRGAICPALFHINENFLTHSCAWE